MDIGRITTVLITCKGCKKVFTMDRKEIRWYSNII